MKRSSASLLRIFAAPAIICAICAVGLVSALVADGWGDWISWIALATPVAVTAWAWAKRT